MGHSEDRTMTFLAACVLILASMLACYQLGIEEERERNKRNQRHRRDNFED